MSKERLEEIKYYREMESFDPWTQSDINWLIEQAERVHELEKEIENLETDLWHANHYRALSVQKNKRYREALEFIGNHANESEMMDDVMYTELVKEVIEKALEE